MERQLLKDYEPMPESEVRTLEALFTNPDGLTERQLANQIDKKRSAPYIQKLRERGLPIVTENRGGEDVYRLER